MSSQEPKFCLSRAERAHFEPMHGYRDWLKIRDLGLSEATYGQFDAWVIRANDIEIFELVSPAEHSAIDV